MGHLPESYYANRVEDIESEAPAADETNSASKQGVAEIWQSNQVSAMAPESTEITDFDELD